GARELAAAFLREPANDARVIMVSDTLSPDLSRLNPTPISEGAIYDLIHFDKVMAIREGGLLYFIWTKDLFLKGGQSKPGDGGVMDWLRRLLFWWMTPQDYALKVAPWAENILSLAIAT